MPNLPYYRNEFSRDANFVCFRLKANLEHTCVIPVDYSRTEEQLSDQFEKIIQDLSKSAFLVPTLNLLISDGSKNVPSVDEIYKKYHKKDLTKISDDAIKHRIMDFVPIDLISKVTTSTEENYAPYYTNHRGICRIQTYKMPIDTLVFIETSTPISNIHSVFLEKLSIHLQALKNCYVNYFQNEDTFSPQIYHFQIKIQQFQGIVTCAYPSTNNDDQLTSLRREIHTELELSNERPLLRRVDALDFDSSKDSSSLVADSTPKTHIMNIHLHVKPSDVNGKQSLVKGDYIYYHYMQDGINDNGWGCAYRSFQTIFSWFKLQGLTQKPVPTHRQIQQTLVDLGDKNKDFIGSSKWIGSMEINFCLNKLLNIESKIMMVSKGSELAEKARELQHHFETEGSPVMIGGGVLAHTIIGVDFNEMTGDVKYLVLDPHYTGADDIKSITSKGWAGWKDVKFWKENAFYNLCCPIRYHGI